MIPVQTTNPLRRVRDGGAIHLCLTEEAEEASVGSSPWRPATPSTGPEVSGGASSTLPSGQLASTHRIASAVVVTSTVVIWS